MANQYLEWLIEQPDDDQILSLLWDLYQKHASTDFLLQSLKNQSETQEIVEAKLVYAQLLKKAGRLRDAYVVLESASKAFGKTSLILESMVSLSGSLGLYEEQVQALKKLIPLLPEGSPQALDRKVELALVLGKLHLHQEAAVLWEALSKDPRCSSMQLKLIANYYLEQGSFEKALEIYAKRIERSPEQDRLPIWLEASQVAELHGDYQEAETLLLSGKKLLTPQHPWYERFLIRWYKLYERQGKLESLEKTLLSLAQETEEWTDKQSVWWDLYRCYSWLDDEENCYNWIEKLAKAYPKEWKYQQAWLELSLERSEAELVLNQLQGDFSSLLQLHPDAVFLKLRALVLSDQKEECAAWLLEGSRAKVVPQEMKKELRSFAQSHGFFVAYEQMLLQQYRDYGGEKNAFMELAKFLQQQGKTKELEKWVNEFIYAKPEERATRLSLVAELYGRSANQANLEKLNRDAATAPDAGREEWLQLVDVLVSEGKTEHALTWLEKSLLESRGLDQLLEVDERIYTVRGGGTGPQEVSLKPTQSVQILSLFTGEGFGEEREVEEKIEFVPEEIQIYALERVYPFLDSKVEFEAAMDQLSELPYNQLKRELPYVKTDHPLSMFRAFWWAVKAKMVPIAEQLQTRPEYQELLKNSGFQKAIAKLELEISMEKKDDEGIERGLKELLLLDVPNALNYELHLVEHYLRKGDKVSREAAVIRLEALVANQFYDELVMSQLSQLYFESGAREKAIALWKDAIEASQFKNQALIEKYSEILLAQRESGKFWGLLMDSLLRETHHEKREQLLQRSLDRVNGLFNLQNAAEFETYKAWVIELEKIIIAQSKRHPLEGFWQVAQSEIYLRLGDESKSYQALKAAYYAQPESVEMLKDLKALALRVGNLNEAMLFQQQYSLAYRGGKDFGEWQVWIDLLEQHLELGRADEVKVRMEQKFAQDARALEIMAGVYLQTSQKFRARKVLEKLERLPRQGVDAGIRLALEFEKAGDILGGMRVLESWLQRTSQDAKAQPETDIGVSLWVADSGLHGNLPEWFTNAVQGVSGLSDRERSDLQAHAAEPRDYLAAYPSDLKACRLRALFAWAKWNQSLGSARKELDPVCLVSQAEHFWNAFFQKKAESVAVELRRLRGDVGSKGKFWFDWFWLCIEANQWGLILTEVESSAFPASQRAEMKRWLKAALQIHAEKPEARWGEKGVKLLSAAGLLAQSEWRDLARKFEFKRDYTQALNLLSVAFEGRDDLSVEQWLHQAKLASLAKDYALEKKLLERALASPSNTVVSSWNAFDPWIQGLRRYLDLCVTHEEGQQAILKVRRHLLTQIRAGDAPLRLARVDGKIGAVEKAISAASFAQATQGLTPFPFAEPLMSRLLPRSHREHGEAVNPQNQLADYWDNLSDWQSTIQEDGLLSLLKESDRVVEEYFGGVLQGSRTSAEFRRWKIQSLAISLLNEKASKRRYLVERFVEKDSSIEMLGELGSYLEAQGFYRECLPFYKTLPLRAPTNNDYSEQFLRASDQAWESEEAIEYLVKLIAAVAELKPNGISRDLMREMHAFHLTRLHRFEDLEALSNQPIAQSRRGTVGRNPEPVAYLRALAKLRARYGETLQVEEAWQRLLAIMPEDQEATLELVKIRYAKGDVKGALELARKVQFTTYWSVALRDLFIWHVKLQAELKNWNQVDKLLRRLNAADLTPQGMWSQMIAPVQGDILLAESYDAIAEILVAHGYAEKAMHLLLRSLRSAKSQESRSRYLASLLRLSDPDKEESSVVLQDMLILLQELELGELPPEHPIFSEMEKLVAGPKARAWVELLEKREEPLKRGAILYLQTLLVNQKGLPETFSAWRELQSQEPEQVRSLLKVFLSTGQAELVKRILQVLPESASDPELRFQLAVALKDEALWTSLMEKDYVWFQAQAPLLKLKGWAGMEKTQQALEWMDVRLKQMRSHGLRDEEFIASAVTYLISVNEKERAQQVLADYSSDLTVSLPKLVALVYKEDGANSDVLKVLESMDLPDALYKECLFELRVNTKG